MSPPPLHPHPDTGRGRLPTLPWWGVPWSPGPGLPAATARGRLPGPRGAAAVAQNANAPAPPYSEGAGHQPDRWGRAPCSVSRSL